ncbi:ATP synthase F1 subunit delta [Anaerophaga thermohalophila]|jgi:F-type H+-transporting ATPase subunit delta|uniref:ATP synthase F1 subunit delta n=1 Tax=Anaerophaga thermohalophila TaxID=177400 RepID=UPI00031036F9|nr:ATP synthase F1 subunit delta [Anaerophaga thermohalophila]
MNRGPITIRYARALFELAKERNELDRLYQDSKLLLDHCLKVRDFCAFLNNPVIKASQKKNVLKKVLSGEQHPLMIRFLDLIIDKNRENFLHDIIISFEDLYKKHKGIRSVKVITAVKMDLDYMDKLQIYLEREFDRPVEIQNQVKPDIIGGVILVVDEEIIDNSIGHQIKLLRNKLLS